EARARFDLEDVKAGCVVLQGHRGAVTEAAPLPSQVGGRSFFGVLEHDTPFVGGQRGGDVQGVHGGEIVVVDVGKERDLVVLRERSGGRRRSGQHLPQVGVRLGRWLQAR